MICVKFLIYGIEINVLYLECFGVWFEIICVCLLEVCFKEFFLVFFIVVDNFIFL